jgi:hypothetical protein
MPVPRLLPLFLLIAGIALLPAGASSQQEVRGTVVEGGSDTPVQGAMVVLLEGEVTLARGLTGADGTFRISVERPGRYELRVDRIGYLSTYTQPFDLPDGGTIVRTVESQVEAVVLSGISVEASGRCELRPEEGRATAILWEEARKALETATWTSERGVYRFAWTRFRRELGPDARSVVSEERTVRSERLPQPFVSVDAEILARDGFLRDDGDGLRYAAPDASVLLSDAFLDTHCFRVASGRDGDEELVGLRFEPVPGRSLPEVEGILWLGARTGRLRSLEYAYVNLPWDIGEHRAGGELFFEGLPNGTWIVHEWSIRMPRLVERRSGAGQLVGHEVLGYRVDGSVVNVVATVAGEIVDRQSQPGAVLGIVADSLGQPAAGARVWIAGTDFVAETGRDGRFAFAGVGEGTWSVGATLPSLERVGHPGTFAEIGIERGSSGELRMELPSARTAALTRCEAPSPDDPPTVLVGRVVDEAGRPVAGAAVRALWSAGMTQEGVGLESDANGRFVVCGFPPSRSVRAWATMGARESRVVETSVVSAPGVALIEVELATVASLAAAGPGTGADFATGKETAWLTSKGFPLRADFALLHQTQRDISGRGLESLERVFTQVSRLEARDQVTGRIEYRLHASDAWAADPESSSSCPLELFLNGSLVRANLPALMVDASELARGAGADFRPLDLDRWLRPNDLTAVEMFDGGETPVTVPGGCGAALLWVHRLEHPEDPDFTGALRGRVVRAPEEAPLADVLVRLQPGGLERRTDAFGRFDYGRLPPARYRVEVAVPDWGEWATELLLRAGSLADVAVQVEPLAVAGASP